VALTLISASAVVFLDEPSSGVDPISRRLLWSVVQAFQQHCTFVLTTHMLEEANQVCAQIAMLVAAEVRGVGTSLELKQKFAAGFTLQISCVNADNIDNVCAFVFEKWPAAVLEERFGHTVSFNLSEIAIDQAFDIIEAKKAELGISDYAIGESTLEKAFLRMCHRYEEQRQ